MGLSSIKKPIITIIFCFNWLKFDKKLSQNRPAFLECIKICCELGFVLLLVDWKLYIYFCLIEFNFGHLDKIRNVGVVSDPKLYAVYDNNSWIVDSGANVHLYIDRHAFYS